MPGNTSRRPQFAVNRAAILSRIRGVQLSKDDKDFSSGHPRLENWTSATAAMALATRAGIRHGRQRPSISSRL